MPCVIVFVRDDVIARLRHCVFPEQITRIYAVRIIPRDRRDNAPRVAARFDCKPSPTPCLRHPMPSASRTFSCTCPQYSPPGGRAAIAGGVIVAANHWRRPAPDVPLGSSTVRCGRRLRCHPRGGMDAEPRGCETRCPCARRAGRPWPRGPGCDLPGPAADDEADQPGRPSRSAGLCTPLPPALSTCV
jgi:hypothetical protein